MDRNQIETFVERWLRAVKEGNPAEFEHLVAAQVMDTNTGEQSSLSAFQTRAVAVHRTFAELEGHVDELLIDGEHIAWRWTLSGVQRAPFLGEAASGKLIHLHGVNMQRLTQGRVVAHYTLLDTLDILRQIRDA